MSRSLWVLALVTAWACSAPGAVDAGGAGGGGSDSGYTGFDCRTQTGSRVCTEPGASAVDIGSCGADGVCLCQPGYVRSPITSRCWPETGFCRGPDGGFFTATGVSVAPSGHCNAGSCGTGGTCYFDAGIATCAPPADGQCVPPPSCGLLECRNGCRCASSANGNCTCDGPDACEVGNDASCNDNPAMQSFAGTCVQVGSSPRRCICSPGFERNPVTGKCRPLDAG